MVSLKTWLILDANYLCWRAFHALRGPRNNGLSSNGIRTEIIFGFMRDVIALQSVHNTDRIVFCFDRKSTKRMKLYPRYKANREAKDEYEAEMYQEARIQIQRLRMEILPELGFKNIFSQKGYEADDVIASIVDNRKLDEEMIIVSRDSDLYQLLAPRVMIWQPYERRMVTFESFQKEKGILPRQWPMVKALWGDVSDNIKGVHGVGELTALRYVRGDLPEHSKAYQNIMKEKDLWIANMRLVELPFEGIKTFKRVNDRFATKYWDRLVRKYEMESLREKVSGR